MYRATSQPLSPYPHRILRCGRGTVHTMRTSLTVLASRPSRNFLTLPD